MWTSGSWTATCEFIDELKPLDRGRPLSSAGRARRGLGRALLQGAGPRQARRRQPATAPDSTSRSSCSAWTTPPSSERRGRWSSAAGRPAHPGRRHHGRKRLQISLAQGTAPRRQGLRDERPPGRHRRHLQGVRHFSDVPDPLHAVSPGAAVHPAGAPDPVGRLGPSERRGSIRTSSAGASRSRRARAPTRPATAGRASRR